MTQLAKGGAIVEKNSTVPALAHLHIRAESGQRWLYVDATDLEVSVSWAIEATVQSSGAVAVQADAFKRVLAGAGKGEIYLHVSEPGELSITCPNGAKTTLRGLPAKDFPTLPTVDADNTRGAASLPAESFYPAVERTLPAVSSEESRFQLPGALFDPPAGEDSSGLIVSTDGHRLHSHPCAFERCADGKTRTLPDPFLVPRKALSWLSKLPAKVRPERLYLAVSDHHFRLTAPRFTLVSRILEGSFPDYERVIKTGQTSKSSGKTYRRLELELEPAALGQAVQAVIPAVGDHARAVRANLNGAIELTAIHPDLGEATATCPVLKSNGVETELGLNPDYLLAMAKAAGEEPFTLHAWSPNDQVVAHTASGGRFVLMPIRL